MLTHPLTLVIIAFVVMALLAFLLSKKIGKNLESLTVMGGGIIGGRGRGDVGGGCAVRMDDAAGRGRAQIPCAMLRLRRGWKT